MKTAAVVAILTLSAASVSAQHLKAVGGVGVGHYAANWEMTTERRTGTVVGGGVEFGNERVALELDVLYMQKRHYYVSRGWEFQLTELSAPALVKVKPWRGVSPYVVGGWETALILSQGETGDSPGERWTLETKKVDFGLVAGGGVSFPVGPSSVEIEARYHYGLADTTRFSGDSYDFKTRVFVLLGALRF